jgi:hypothetical protein
LQAKTPLPPERRSPSSAALSRTAPRSVARLFILGWP